MKGRRASCLIPIAIMAAGMRAMILIPLLMISFSYLLKGTEKGSFVPPGQSCPQHGRAVCSWKGGADKRDVWGAHAIVPQMQQFFSITNELHWIKYICTKSKINIALFNATKRLGFSCPWPEAPSSSIDWPVSGCQTSCHQQLLQNA